MFTVGCTLSDQYLMMKTTPQPYQQADLMGVSFLTGPDSVELTKI